MKVTLNKIASPEDKSSSILKLKVLNQNVKPKIVPVHNDSDEDVDVDSEDSKDSSSSEDGDFYVELSLTCTNDDDDYGEHNIIFNFGSESKYMEHAENGFDELDGIFEDAIATHFPSWTYANEWEESCVHGPDLPDDYDGAVIDIQ
jgi:hypothetical protein